MGKKRMVGDYEITAAITVGDKEIIIGENESAIEGERFMCAIAKRRNMFELYSSILLSDGYPEIAELFGERVSAAARHIRKEIDALKGASSTVITMNDCIPDNRRNDINGKVIAIDRKALKPGYDRAERQLYIVKGGSGAAANARDNAVFCKNIYDGRTFRFERRDILGEVKPECVPDWAKQKLSSPNFIKDKENRER